MKYSIGYEISGNSMPSTIKVAAYPFADSNGIEIDIPHLEILAQVDPKIADVIKLLKAITFVAPQR